MATNEEKYQETLEADGARQREWSLQNSRSYQEALERDWARQNLSNEQSAENDKEQQFEQQKMGWGTFLIALALSLIADIVEFFTLGTLGWFVGLVVDLILLAMLGFSKAGKKQWKKWVWGPIIEKVPILNILPFRVVFLIWAFVASRNKKLQKVQKVMEMKKSIPASR